MWNEAIEPYLNYHNSEEETIDLALKPLRRFMFKQMDRRDLALFVRLTNKDAGTNTRIRLSEVKTHVVVTAFMTSELKRAFKMGFLLYLPFVVIDLVVASVLISMGMLVLPPILISLPFKVLVFVLVDGWGLVIGKLAESFLGG